MKIRLSPQLIKSSLSSHSWLGLLVGGLMYIICLSGTLAIFYEEIERWEQPVADEYLTIDAHLLEDSFNRYVSEGAEVTEHMYLVFPNEALPRAKVSNEFNGRYINADGSLGADAYDDLSGLFTGLHINLHMPVSIGVVVVSALGALLCGLIITGFLAHPSIVKDAFKLRTGSTGRMGQVDLHNRLSVWGAPFHLMIALTGAYYGLILLIVGMFASSIDGASPQSINQQIFPSEPEVENQASVYSVARALEQVRELSPDGKLLYLIVHDANSENRFMEFYVQQPGLLAWSENYRFDTAGNYLGAAGYTEGEAAQQVLYSVYRIHFGHFGGFITKLFYVVLGMSLTVVSATGINIWLQKRKYRDALNLIWPGIVWGMPLALVVASFTQVIFHLPSSPVFWGCMVVAMTAGLFVQNEAIYKRYLLNLTALSLVFLVSAYGIKFESYALVPAGLSINLVLLAAAVWFFLAAYDNRRRELAAQLIAEDVC
ncbi:MAG: peptidase [SAR86 cluster bacterium]|uniref:Peptidase n=1 Tax=SAR86 cluster bacterium TaxID=2030880 RepID=A0A2A5AX55_9GAMM|nr:MAG: peptidase [SAR86 cluster bacterium]